MIQHDEILDRIHLELSPFQHRFLSVSVPELQRLLLAALYLDIRDLLTFAAQRSALTMMDGKPVEDIRQEWGFPDDLTEEVA